MIEVLERDLPPATLLIGPEPGTLFWGAHRALLKAHGVHKTDIYSRRHVSASDARIIVRFCQTAPFRGAFKAVVALLDGSTPQAQNILLRVLEEPPPAVRFILVASGRPLPTVVSRCQVVMVPAARMAAEPDAAVTAKVDAVLRAAQSGDLRGLDQALRGWDAAHHAVLSLLLAEAAAGRDPDGRISPGQARKLLGALSRFDSAQPRLAAHAALAAVLVP